MAQAQLRTPSRLELIEAVRGLAAVMVVWSHSENYRNVVTNYVIDFGKIGVVVFFFISGYLVIPSAVKDGDVRSFLVKRVFRLYPLYWLSIVAALWMWPQRLSIAGWIANLTMGQQLLGFDNAIDVYWTLTIEFCLYVLITGALLYDKRLLDDRLNYLILFACLACVGSGVARWVLREKVATAIPLGLFCMFLGAKLRTLHARRQSMLGYGALYLVTIAITCGFAYSFSIRFGETPSRYICSYLIGAYIFTLILRFPGVSLGRAFHRLGDYSYGIYLFHVIFIKLLSPQIHSPLLLFTLALLPTILVSGVLHHYVELPAARWGKTLAYGGVK